MLPFSGRLRLVLVALVLAGLVTGCARVSTRNLKKIKAGMSEEEVIDILGEPDEMEEKVIPNPGLKTVGARKDLPAKVKWKHCQWTDGDKKIRVTFIEGQVAGRGGEGL